MLKLDPILYLLGKTAHNLVLSIHKQTSSLAFKVNVTTTKARHSLDNKFFPFGHIKLYLK